MQTRSLWEHTLTFFPQFLATLQERTGTDATVTVVGASDGKFVLPLAAAGYRVLAVERDPVALRGGEADLPGGTRSWVPGLVDRLKQEGLQDRVHIVEADFLDASTAVTPGDAVWTSCSWHYSANHHHPLIDFIARMQATVRIGGLFGAEFMMPHEARHQAVQHYTSPEKLSRHFDSDWDVLLTLRTNEFTERPHVGRLEEHTHRMGVLLAARTGK